MIFAIELSTKMGSVALVKEGQVVAEKSWEENFKNRQQLFDSIALLQQESGISWGEVELFAVGRGPGAFSGMRVAFSVANSLAMPGGKPVYAINSGLPLVAQVAAESGASSVAVVGDARRNQLWAGLFSVEGDVISCEKEFTLMAHDELKNVVLDDSLVVSPDADRLEKLLADFKTPPPEMGLYPTAGTLGKLVEKLQQQGVESEAAEPLYMHPPVFIEPRFPG